MSDVKGLREVISEVKGLRGRVRDVIIGHLNPEYASNAKSLIGEEAQIVDNIVDDILGEVNSYSKDMIESSTKNYQSSVGSIRVSYQDEINKLKAEIESLENKIAEYKSNLKHDEVISTLETKLAKSQKVVKLLKKLNRVQQDIIEEEL